MTGMIRASTSNTSSKFTFVRPGDYFGRLGIRREMRMETIEASFLTMLVDRLSSVEEGMCRLSEDIKILKPIADVRLSIEEVDIHTLQQVRMKAQLFSSLEDICTCEGSSVWLPDISKQVALALKAKGFRVFEQTGIARTDFLVWCDETKDPARSNKTEYCTEL